VTSVVTNGPAICRAGPGAWQVPRTGILDPDRSSDLFRVKVPVEFSDERGEGRDLGVRHGAVPLMLPEIPRLPRAF
jgi:hypothetical protein